VVFDGVDIQELKLLVDAQTSGGLLATMSPADSENYLEEVPGATVIGEIRSDPGLEVVRS
jgi:hypothetical protein